MDQRIETALRKEVPQAADEGHAASPQKDESIDEQLNSDDDISDYNEELDTGDNILLGYFVKVFFGVTARPKERKTSEKFSSSIACCE